MENKKIIQNQEISPLQYSSVISLTFLVIMEWVLILSTLLILGLTINWPASLGDPASVVLPLIKNQWIAVMIGYSLYLIYSILVFPLIILLCTMMKGQSFNRIELIEIAKGFSLASMIFRLLGILRWLTVMQVLSGEYRQESNRKQVRLLFESFNSYAGSLGETLGVSLLMGMTIFLISYYMIKEFDMLPKWIGYMGIISSILLTLGILPMYGIDLFVVSVLSIVVLHVWYAIISFYFYKIYKNNKIKE
ncbi:MAG: DUF4386 family protein [Candidatus Hermodarchaeota archaeon]